MAIKCPPPFDPFAEYRRASLWIVWTLALRFSSNHLNFPKKFPSSYYAWMNEWMDVWCLTIFQCTHVRCLLIETLRALDYQFIMPTTQGLSPTQLHAHYTETGSASPVSWFQLISAEGQTKHHFIKYLIFLDPGLVFRLWGRLSNYWVTEVVNQSVCVLALYIQYNTGMLYLACILFKLICRKQAARCTWRMHLRMGRLWKTGPVNYNSWRMSDPVRCHWHLLAGAMIRHHIHVLLNPQMDITLWQIKTNVFIAIAPLYLI